MSVKFLVLTELYQSSSDVNVKRLQSLGYTFQGIPHLHVSNRHRILKENVTVLPQAATFIH